MDNPCFLKELPVVFLSYDEPSADKNYARIYNKFPCLIRVHGVKGFDAAHKVAAAEARKLRNTTHFVTIDADNIDFNSNVWSHELADYATLLPGREFADLTFSFRAVNSVNAACYGNGGVKIWSHKFVSQMKTHEANPEQVDFCWDMNYVQLQNIASTTDPATDPERAFRAGYREGLKLCYASTRQGRQGVWTNEFSKITLGHWLTLGLDAPNGQYMILGALRGALAFQESRGLYGLLSHEDVKVIFSSLKRPPFDEIRELSGKAFRIGLSDCPVPFTPHRSAFIKTLILNQLDWRMQPRIR